MCGNILCMGEEERAVVLNLFLVLLEAVQLTAVQS